MPWEEKLAGKRGRISRELSGADAIRAATQGPGPLNTVAMHVGMRGPRGCVAPPWDTRTIYRLEQVGDGLQIQRYVNGRWEAAPHEPPKQEGESMAEKRASTIKIFISHSSKDKDIVKALIDFIEASIDAPTGTIRCTTVPGYKLEGGDDGADVLRADLANANVVIGVFTASSMLSRFVLMELGAGWGLDKRCIPLIGPGADFKDLVGPYQKLHGVKLDSLEDMADIPKTIANATGLPKLDNAAKAIDALGKLVALVKAAPLSKDGAVAAPPAKAPPSSMDDNDRVLKLQRWLSKQDDVSAKDFLEIDAEAGVPEGSAKRLLDQWVSKPWRIAGPGSTCVTLERHEAVVQVVPRKGFFDDSDF